MTTAELLVEEAAKNVRYSAGTPPEEIFSGLLDELRVNRDDLDAELIAACRRKAGL